MSSFALPPPPPPPSSSSSRKRSSDTPISNSNNSSSDGDDDDDGMTATTVSSPCANHASASKSTTKLRIRINKFHGVAKWTWNVGNGGDDEVCGICQEAFEGCPPGVKFPGDESPVVFGTCGEYTRAEQTTSALCAAMKWLWFFSSSIGIKYQSCSAFRAWCEQNRYQQRCNVWNLSRIIIHYLSRIFIELNVCSFSGHAFHLQCVATWLNSNKQTCPICRADWEYGNSGDQHGSNSNANAANANAANANANVNMNTNTNANANANANPTN